jgi:Fe-S-cluster containining protein
MRTFNDQMAALYAEMQDAYDRVRAHYGFSCEGCAENCCTQRFLHHTMAEYRYLLHGLREADPALVRRIMTRAREAMHAYAREEASGEPEEVICPANEGGLCTVYAHRPMICRMHGLPHRFRRPDGREERGGGCGPFVDATPKADWSVNRTGLYQALARMERDLRRTGRHAGSMSTAAMLVDMWERDEGIRAIMEAR